MVPGIRPVILPDSKTPPEPIQPMSVDAARMTARTLLRGGRSTQRSIPRESTGSRMRTRRSFRPALRAIPASLPLRPAAAHRRRDVREYHRAAEEADRRILARNPCWLPGGSRTLCCSPRQLLSHIPDSANGQCTDHVCGMRCGRSGGGGCVRRAENSSPSQDDNVGRGGHRHPQGAPTEGTRAYATSGGAIAPQ